MKYFTIYIMCSIILITKLLIRNIYVLLKLLYVDSVLESRLFLVKFLVL